MSLRARSPLGRSPTDSVIGSRDLWACSWYFGCTNPIELIMQTYLLRRILQLLPTLLTASILIFFIIALAPGDPAAMRLGPEATQEQIANERERLGLAQPLPVRYAIWLGDV